jgi:hypothetical protein
MNKVASYPYIQGDNCVRTDYEKLFLLFPINFALWEGEFFPNECLASIGVKIYRTILITILTIIPIIDWVIKQIYFEVNNRGF